LKLVLAELRIEGKLVSLDTDPVAIEGKSKTKSTGWRAAMGAAAGGVVGGAAAGKKGAGMGAGIGGAAGVASSAMTSGPEIRVEPETSLAFVVR